MTASSGKRQPLPGASAGMTRKFCTVFTCLHVVKIDRKIAKWWPHYYWKSRHPQLTPKQVVAISSWFGLFLGKYMKVTTNGLLLWWSRKKTREKLIICIISVISTLLDWPYSFSLHVFRPEVFCLIFEVFEWRMNLFSLRLSSRMSTKARF